MNFNFILFKISQAYNFGIFTIYFSFSAFAGLAQP